MAIKAKKPLVERIDASNKKVSDDLRAKRESAPAVFRTKLGPAKGAPKSRIWLQGRRLVAAGFTVGKFFVKELHVDRPWHPRLRLSLCDDTSIYSTMPCKVSGKGATPIIDITGDGVRRTFGALGTHVEVTFRKGIITITGAVS